jgi:ATP-dependent Zn protease
VKKIAILICSIVTHVTFDLNSFFLNLIVGKSTHKKIKPEDVKVNFSNVAGCDEAKKEIVEFVDFLQSPEVRLFHYINASFLIRLRRSGWSCPL